MTPEDASAVWKAVWRLMGEWEADLGTGSARHMFVGAWLQVTETMALTEPPSRLELETAWGHWCQGGEPLTADRKAELRSREPGQEG